ncbi:MAG TPA: hypothetical protein VFB58_16480 [Chloroflexota bacterium]|nr:hypothetical protein [Chloroflexota bacterium]
MAGLTDSSGDLVDQYSYDPLGNIRSSTTPVANPFTFQGGMHDSATGVYYTGSGYYDPANGQAFGCQDQGWVDPGEDLCGEDEPFATYCRNLVLHSGSASTACNRAYDPSYFWVRLDEHERHQLEVAVYLVNSYLWFLDVNHLSHHPIIFWTVSLLFTNLAESAFAAGVIACRHREYLDLYYHTLKIGPWESYPLFVTYKCAGREI